MNWKFFVSSSFICLLLPFASAQTTPSSESSSRVTAAHCRYSSSDPDCAEPDRTSPPLSEATGARTAQCRRPCPWPPRRGYPQGPPRPSHPPYLFQPEYGNHAAAGAIVGFLIGATAGATAKSDGQNRLPAALLIGGLGAVMGAAVGHSIPASHWIHRHPSYPAPDDEEMAAVRPPVPALQEP